MTFLRGLLWILALGHVVLAVPSVPRKHCPSREITIRREWGEMLPAERKSYINAVLCLAQKPPQLPTAEYPGVRSRFDDFVATHINYTLHAHLTGLFLPWHRRFTWLFERALRDECGYTDYLPYWNWPLWADNLSASPLFDCSETSLSGDGAYNPDEQPLSGGNTTIPRGTGGDCTPCGPFKDFQVHMGPFSRELTSLTEIPAPGFDYNPRCLNRSLNNFVSSHYNNASQVTRLLDATDIVDFQTVMDHWPPRPDGVLGLHGGGHYSLGATLQDLFSSPQDPAFMLHHAMIDRLWAMWQNGGEGRRDALNGTNVILNPPWAERVTLDMVMEFGILDEPRRVREVMDPLADGFCYAYS
ncbi:N-acetyl-6-hydroxytryptophan oxidase ivoB [Penicillium macrosclerotiorum]|uniref:N-acetyl-6-hydroxytryptophan oxidase ivoB n=1 Tax=Penicillium macrosclerotiorum TaxID=303699 RepID=UPI002546EEE1|nr:N-acetyl-6-hydroxytryptophan oxidase ivoB [Penicillium macrosclerotiorum]KAJ5683502.1 N-acetyl-6-hydroxytryptophan oxidase ivoB [Penicillium macrosclerotiorum]